MGDWSSFLAGMSFFAYVITTIWFFREVVIPFIKDTTVKTMDWPEEKVEWQRFRTENKRRLIALSWKKPRTLVIRFPWYARIPRYLLFIVVGTALIPFLAWTIWGLA